jgi:hypothetical protein
MLNSEKSPEEHGDGRRDEEEKRFSITNRKTHSRRSFPAEDQDEQRQFPNTLLAPSVPERLWKLFSIHSQRHPRRDPDAVHIQGRRASLVLLQPPVPPHNS